MHKTRNKQRLRIQLAFIYSLMGLSVVAVLAILILVIQGYRYNRYDGKVEQGGLVQFNSRPSGATVSADGVTLANKTASKLTLTAGQHSVSMTREGYSSWQKDVLVKPGSVLWLNYVQLFPTNPEVTTAMTYPAVGSALPSPDHKVMATIPDAAAATISLISLDTDSPVETKVPLPSDSYTAPAAGPAQAFALVAWNKDNDSLLIRHTYGDKTEYLSTNIRTGKTRNITVDLGIDIQKVMYSLSDTSIVYALTANRELRRINIVDKSLSGPLVTNVENFTIPEENILTYTTLPDDANTRTAGYITGGSMKAKKIATYSSAKDMTVRFSIGKYYGDYYTMSLHGDSLDIMRGDIPSSDTESPLNLKKVAQLTVTGGGDYAGFSPGDNRIVYIARGSKVMTYDLELGSTSTVALQAPLTQDVQWLDSYHIMTTGGAGYYYDYDGTNGQLYAAKTNNLPAVMARGEKYIYYFADSDGSTKLQRVKLTTN